MRDDTIETAFLAQRSAAEEVRWQGMLASGVKDFGGGAFGSLELSVADRPESTPGAQAPVTPSPAPEPPSAVATGAKAGAASAIEGSSAIMDGLGKLLLPSLRGVTSPTELPKAAKQVFDGLMSLGLAPFIALGRGAGTALTNQNPELAKTVLVSGTGAMGIRGLMAGKALKDMTPETQQAMLQPMTVAEALDLGVTLAAPVLGPKGVKAAIKKAKTLPEAHRQAVAATREAMAGPLAKVTEGPVGGPVEPAPAGTQKPRVNLERIGASEETKAVIAAVDVAAQQSGQIAATTRGTRPHEETVKASKGKMTVAEALNRQPGDVWNAERQQAARDLRDAAANVAMDLQKRALQGDPAAARQLPAAVALVTELNAQDVGQGAEIARALEGRKIQTDAARQAQAIAELGDRIGGMVDGTTLAVMLDGLPTQTQRNVFMQQLASGAKSGTNMLTEAWINALLSGPQTHAANFLSNTLTTYWAVAEREMAALLHFGAAPGVARGEGVAMLYGHSQGWMDGLRLAGKALREGKEQFGAGKVEHLPAITADAFGLSAETPLGRAADLLGAGIRLPGRALMTSDTLFKVINYRMELHAQAYRQAALEGLDGAAFNARVAQIVSDPPVRIKAQAEHAAAVNTFTNELGTTGQFVMGLTNSHPAARAILPFVRTPTNIWKYTAARTPLAFFTPSFYADVAAGGPRKDLALAKLALGSATMAAVVSLASSGLVTGGGPKNPDLLRQQRSTGWQPYSIKVGDTYYSYNRLDPAGAIFGMAADFAEMSGQLPEYQAEELAATLALAAAKNMTSKTYLEGVATVLEAVADPDANLKKAAGNWARTLIPTGVAQVERVVDPTVRETFSMLDTLKARVPLWSEGLFPDRNIFGEPIVLSGGWGPDLISPIYSSTVKTDPVAMEIARLRVPLSMPPKVLAGSRPPALNMTAADDLTVGIPLTPQEYDVFTRWAGNELKISGRGMKEELARLIASPQYQQQSDGADGGKAFMIRQTVHAYREAARAKLLMEDHTLRELIGEKVRDRIKARQPVPTVGPGMRLAPR